MGATVTPYAALMAAIVALTAVNVLNNRVAVRAYLFTCVVTAALVLTLFRLTGLPWSAAGLGTAGLGRGVVWGAVLVALVAAGYLVAALVPGTRRLFADRRVQPAGAGETGHRTRHRTAQPTAHQVAYQVLLRIPLGTVLLEEVAFRGVLYGLAAHLYGLAWATVLSSVLFGLWHVLPSRELVRLNPAAGRLFRRRAVLSIGAGVLASAVAGLVLCEVLRRSGSLAAPAALHWATNGFGYLTAVLITRAGMVARRVGEE